MIYNIVKILDTAQIWFSHITKEDEPEAMEASHQSIRKPLHDKHQKTTLPPSHIPPISTLPLKLPSFEAQSFGILHGLGAVYLDYTTIIP